MNVYNSGIPGTGVACETNVERIMPIGSLVCVILIVSSMSTSMLEVWSAQGIFHLTRDNTPALWLSKSCIHMKDPFAPSGTLATLGTMSPPLKVAGKGLMSLLIAWRPPGPRVNWSFCATVT